MQVGCKLFLFSSFFIYFNTVFYSSVKEISRVFFVHKKAAPTKTIRRLAREDSISKGIKAGFVG